MWHHMTSGVTYTCVTAGRLALGMTGMRCTALESRIPLPRHAAVAPQRHAQSLLHAFCTHKQNISYVYVIGRHMMSYDIEWCTNITKCLFWSRIWSAHPWDLTQCWPRPAVVEKRREQLGHWLRHAFCEGFLGISAEGAEYGHRVTSCDIMWHHMTSYDIIWCHIRVVPSKSKFSGRGTFPLTSSPVRHILFVEEIFWLARPKTMRALCPASQKKNFFHEKNVTDWWAS